jgi:HK97 family phage major capsid protein
MKRLKARLEEAIKKADAAYEVFLKENTKENLDAYKLCEDLVADLQGKVDELEEGEIDENRNGGNSDPNHLLEDEDKGAKDGKQKLTESQAFFKKLTEAVTATAAFASIIPNEVATKIDEGVYKLARLRQYCTVHKCGGTYSIAIDGDDMTVAYVAENAAIAQTDTKLDAKQLGAFKIGGIVKVSSEMLKDSAVDVEAYLVGKITKAMSKFEDHEILYGAGGTSGITGIVTALEAEDGTPNVTTLADVDAFTYENVDNFIESIDDYMDNAILLMKESTRNTIKHFKDADGRYIFQQNTPLTEINGVPVKVVKDLKAVAAAGGEVIVGGDFSYYHIADRVSFAVKMLYELYAETDQVGMQALYRGDGKPSILEAFKVLKITAAA